MATAVLFVQNTTVNNIASFHDQISNEIPKILDPWSFELKIYRANPIVSKLMSAVPPSQQSRQQPQQSQQSQQQTAQLNKILYTLSLSYNQNQTISIINKNCTIFNTSIDQGQSLMESNCSSGFYDPLDVILQSKLTSLWVLKQSLKGEGGNSYQVTLDNGDVFIIRTANCFLHGGFKGFLIEITLEGRHHSRGIGVPEKQNDEEEAATNVQKIKELITKLNFPKGKLSVGRLSAQSDPSGDLACQYTQALQF